MRFLIAASAAGAVTRYLRNAGHDVSSVRELAPKASDPDILAWAVNEQRIIVTNDKDFGELVFHSGQPHHGIILFRLRDDRGVNQVLVLADALNQYASRLPGRFTVITETGVRIR